MQTAIPEGVAWGANTDTLGPKAQGGANMNKPQAPTSRYAYAVVTA